MFRRLCDALFRTCAYVLLGCSQIVWLSEVSFLLLSFAVSLYIIHTCIALHCVALRYITLHYITSRHVTVQYITAHYIHYCKTRARMTRTNEKCTFEAFSCLRKCPHGSGATSAPADLGFSFGRWRHSLAFDIDQVEVFLDYTFAYGGWRAFYLCAEELWKWPYIQDKYEVVETIEGDFKLRWMAQEAKMPMP